MEGWLNLAGYKRLYILGAGFSAPAGIPLTNDLLPLVFAEAAKIQTPDTNSALGHAQILLDELNLYFPGIQFDPDRLLNGKVPKEFDFEKFLTYASVISTCQEGTGEQLDEHGNMFISYLKSWTATAIHEQQAKAMRELPALYTAFAQSMQDAVVFTFNWDTLLEHAFALSDTRFNLDRGTYCEPPTVLLLKLHGSIDWFSGEGPLRKSWMNLLPLGKSMPSIARASDSFDDLPRYYRAGMTPWIVLPAFDKTYQIAKYDDLWQMLYLLLQNELEVYIIGFSMRADDYHTHAIIYPQLVQGAQEGRIRVKVVDLASSCRAKRKIEKRFAHIPNRKFWFDGFTEGCLEFMSS